MKSAPPKPRPRLETIAFDGEQKIVLDIWAKAQKRYEEIPGHGVWKELTIAQRLYWWDLVVEGMRLR